MKKVLIIFGLIGLLFPLGVNGQKSIDLNMQFPPGTGPNRNYSIYEPTSFSTTQHIKLVIGFHPTNVDGKSWRDELIGFSELTQTLIVCPDGESDGRIDDPEDYAFINALIDSIQNWYLIEPYKVFGLGFSVGGKAVYEFGLKHDKKFKGFIPVGAAIELSDIIDISYKAKCNSFYLVHGKQDQPNSRYYPLKDEMGLYTPMVDGILMDGVGHTFNFTNRDAILKMAFTFVDTSECDLTAIFNPADNKIGIFPTIIDAGMALTIQNKSVGIIDIETIEVYKITGEKEKISVSVQGNGRYLINTSDFSSGLYILGVQIQNEKIVRRFLVR